MTDSEYWEEILKLSQKDSLYANSIGAIYFVTFGIILKISKDQPRELVSLPVLALDDLKITKTKRKTIVVPCSELSPAHLLSMAISIVSDTRICP